MMDAFHFGKWLSKPQSGEEVVISGVSGHLPESDNITEFKENIFNKKDLVVDDDKRWSFYHPEMPKKIAKILNHDQSDPGYFGLHYRQANNMDPCMRKFLETAVEAVIDAGINPSELEGTRTGVFVGVCTSEMDCEILKNITQPQTFGVRGYFKAFFSHRVSYFLKLKGPSFVLDTACSSSSNALEHAFRAIRTGQCDNAIVGGCNLLLHPGFTLQFARLGVLSMDGVCKVFDENADGYVRSESIVCVFLQKAKNAKRIYAQVQYVKVNSDGFKTQGITFPSSEMQKQLMTEVMEDSEIAASDFSFFEAHGTGTAIGDPQEVDAIDQAVAKKREKPLLIGSIKCNIGHSEPASGLCSLVKIIIAMETGLISPNINLKTLRKGIKGFEEGRLKVVTELTELEGNEALVGINNFGFGGSNCHMIVRRFNKQKVDGGIPKDNIPRLICISGRTKNSVYTIIDNLKQKSLDHEYVGLLHQLFKKNVNNHLYRGYAIFSKEGLVAFSTKRVINQPSLHIFFGKFVNNYSLLSNYLLQFQVFKTFMSEINKLLNNMAKISLKGQKSLGATVVQLGLVHIFKLLEIQPTTVFGESSGKLAVAYYYETITLEEALLTACKLSDSLDEKTLNNEDIFSNFNADKRENTYSLFGKYNYLQKESGCNDHICIKNDRSSSRTSILLNVSDDVYSKKDFLLVEKNKVQFLDVLGRLYQKGFNPQIHKIYPPVEYPVSRNTPMISPVIKWNHKRWYTFKFEGFNPHDSLQKEFKLSYFYEHCRYLAGHVIDGRNFVAATEYLHIVWQTFAQSRRLLTSDTHVVFENCKFLRAVTLDKSGYANLLVSIREGTGNFEILEKESLVVSGRIYCCSASDIVLHETNLPSIPLEENNKRQLLEQDEIYRELYLRGYNYSGLFKGIMRCNVEASAGLIKWEGNWTTFMDKMLQMKILQSDTRLLYVPVGIKKIIINTAKQKLVTKETDLIPVNVYKENNVIKAGGIEIIGLHPKSISRRKPRLEPVLEKSEFVPNQSELDIKLAMTVNTQIILENAMESHFKAVEIFDNFYESDSQLLLPIIDEVLGNIPMVHPDLTISTKQVLENISHIKVEDVTLTPSSNFVLIAGIKILERPNLNSILSAVTKNGFILTKEDINFASENVENIEIITEYTTQNEKLILFRQSKSMENQTYIEITSQNFNWLTELQEALKCKSQIVVYSQNEELSGILGLVNCIRREPGGSKVQCFFMMDAAPKFDPNVVFYQQQIKKNLAINVYKNSQWGTYRHLLLEKLEEVESYHCYANTTTAGNLSSLKWFKGSITSESQLEKDEVLVYNFYSSINFKDVMLASGRINVDVFTQDRREQECVLGFELAGVDNTGKRVFAMTNTGALATHVKVKKNDVWIIPDEWTLEQAVTVPTVYSTVIYALLKVISLKRGMSILIHSATGGVGLAAINVCLYYDCTIFVTVGTDEKREYLRKNYPQIPESHIGNSHDISFEEMVKTETKGQGIDVVLNSLAEEKLMASVRCLAKGGNLLEIGKYDLGNDTSLNLLLLEKEISYHGVMLDQLFAHGNKTNSWDWIKQQLYEGIRLGYVKPLPVTVFEANEIEKAFRFMTTGKHIGKIIIKVRDEKEYTQIKRPSIISKGIPKFFCDPVKTYIIIGGLGGVGLELADWFVLRGAKYLILVSSSGIKTGYQTQRIRIWESYGVNVQISTCDVTTEDGCMRLLKESSKYGPVDGIFNLAVVLEDALFEDQTQEKFKNSLLPKAYATKYLDKFTRGHCPQLRYFVVFSSVSCGRGNAGQTNYGMANSIMERICERRKRDGFPALAIQWGAIGEVGLVAKMQKENKELVIGGTLQQKVSSCLQALDIFLNQNNPIVSSMVVAEKHSKIGSSSAVETIAYILGIKDLKEINQNATFPELGMDSMVGNEIIQILEKDFEIYISAKEVRTLTFAKISELEAEKHGTSVISNSSKGESIENLIFLNIPNSDLSKLPIIKLPSKANDEIDTSKVFVLCGIEGMHDSLEKIIKNLNVHVFVLHYSYNNPQDTIEDTAKSLLPHMEEHLLGEKTFQIIAYSYGTAVALELVVLLEGKGFSGTVIFIEGAPAYLTAAVIELVPHDSEAEFETWILTKLLSFLLPKDSVLQKKNEFIQCRNLDERLNLGRSLAEKYLSSAVLERVEEQCAIVMCKRFKAILNYKFSHNINKSSIHLFKAKQPLVTNTANDYNLSQTCKQVTVTELEGNHVTILQQEKLIEDINQLLNSKLNC